MAPAISLCICTMNRPEELRKCLDSVARSTLRPAQLIVSDDSGDDFREINRRLVEEHAGATYLPGPRRGLSANRNNCLRIVTGDYVSFIDDDVVLAPDFLEAAAREHQRLMGSGRGDRIIVTGHEIRPTGPVGHVNVSFLGAYTDEVAEDGKPNSVCMNSALFPAKLFEEAAFDENIFYGTEERDISFQAMYLGYEIVYSPSLVNHHFPSAINRDVYNKVIETARFYFCLKRHGILERSIPRFLLYNLYGPVQAVGSRLRRGRVRDAGRVLLAFTAAWGKFAPLVASGRTFLRLPLPDGAAVRGGAGRPS